MVNMPKQRVKNATDQCNLHRCNLYKPVVSGVQSMDFDDSTKKLAVIRANKSLEIWHCRHHFVRLFVYPPVHEFSVESVVWCKERLFTTGLDGFLLEFEPHSFLPNETKISASAIWCVTKSFNQTHLAIGTEDGGILLVQVEKEPLQVDRTFSRTEKRIVSLSWHKDGIILVSGSVDEIRVWSIETTTCLLRINVPRKTLQVQNVIWSVSVSDDLTIASGDSAGRVSLWNAKNGTLINAFESHKADVLTVVWDNIQKYAYASGIDPTINSYVSVEETVETTTASGTIDQLKIYGFDEDEARNRRRCFIEGVGRNFHTHDVKSLLVASDGRLISGSLDGFIVASKYPPRNVSKVSPFDVNSILFARHTNRVLFRYDKSLEYWQLGIPEIGPAKSRDRSLDLSKPPKKMFELEVKKRDFIYCVALNCLGNCISYSNGKETTILCLQISTIFDLAQRGNEDHQVKGVVEYHEVGDRKLIGSSALTFGQDETTSMLIMATERSFWIIKHQVFQDDPFFDFVGEVPYSGGYKIRKMSSSLSTKYPFAVALTDQEHIVILDFKSQRIVRTLPHHHNTMPVDAKFLAPPHTDLIILYADGALREYSFDEEDFSEFSRQALAPMKPLMWDSPPLGISVYPLNTQNASFMVFNDSQLFFCKKEKNNNLAVRDTCRFNYLCGVGSVRNGDIVIVEVPPKTYLDKLPPSLQMKTFGMK